jgi:hypothetical protein
MSGSSPPPATGDDGDAIGYQVLRRGTAVRSADGEPVGTVRRVLDNAREHIFDGIVVDTPDGRRFVDAPEVARIYERAVVLTITADEARALPPQPSAVADRLVNARTVRNTRRALDSLRERFKDR